MSSKGHLKVIIIGDSGVGKTSLLEAYNYKKISKSAKPTIGAEFVKKRVVLQDGTEVNLQLWDTAGQERFQSLCTSFYRGSDCCMMVFDVSNVDSYDNLEAWRNSFLNTVGDKEVPIFLVGNKSDKECNVNKELLNINWIKSEKVKEFMEVSALKVQGIEDVFKRVA